MEHPEQNDEIRRNRKMTKEQEIFQNMKKRGRIHKAYGKWVIKYPALYVSIKEAGYAEDEQIWGIIDNMIKAGYIRRSLDINGKPCILKHGGNYIITRWAN